MLRSKPADPPSPAAVQVLAAITRLRLALLAEDRDLCAEQIERENAGEKLADEAEPSEVDKLTAHLLNGFASAPRTASGGRTLKQIVTRRSALASATATLQTQEVRASAAAVAEVMQQSGQDWISLQRRRAAAFAEVMAAEAAAEQFRVSLANRTGGQRPSLLGDLGNQPPLTKHALHTWEAIKSSGIADKGVF